MKKLLMTAGMAVLCVHGIAQEGVAEEAAREPSIEAFFQTLTEELKAKVLTSESVEEHCRILEECHKILMQETHAKLDCKPAEEHGKIEMEYVKAKFALPEPSDEELCKMLEEKFDDPGTVDLVMKKLYYMARIDRMTPGHPQALYWARRVAKEKPDEYGWAQEYLTRKGDARDLDLLSRYRREMLQARVAGTNVLHDSLIHGDSPFFIPSVTNTGPQGVYAEAIFEQYWKNMEGVTRTVNGKSATHKSRSQIPPELLTIAVWFDADGNPVCNVDLAKYGLTMPELDVPNHPKGKEKLGIRKEELGMGDEKSATRRLGPYALILPAALAALLLVRRRRR